MWLRGVEYKSNHTTRPFTDRNRLFLGILRGMLDYIRFIIALVAARINSDQRKIIDLTVVPSP